MVSTTRVLDKRRKEFERHLIRSLDVLCYCHLLFVYYLDISILRLLLRSVIQLNYLTPKPFPIAHAIRTRVVYLFILGANAYCFLIHMVTALPTGRESSGGYLHGGLTIQFIGQKVPVSRPQLLFSDLVIAGLQVIIFTITNVDFETASLAASNTSSPLPTSLSAAATLAARTAARASLQQQMQQDHDQRNVIGSSTSPPPVEPHPAQTIDDEELGQRTVLFNSDARRVPTNTSDNDPGSSSNVDNMALIQPQDEEDGFSGEVLAAEIRLTDLLGRTTYSRLRVTGNSSTSSATSPPTASPAGGS
ncbi:uncharacterized protein V1516DRAFT_652699 [Lipomyces oligophaga]|uniref:uncharacterized protein n=1 Tax=Lipomyces oligophaga TaxID=45792 RepID=UPI0034CDCC95